MLRWLVASDIFTREVSEKEALSCPKTWHTRELAASFSPSVKTKETAYFICLLAFMPGHLVFSMTCYLKFLVRKHIGSGISKPKIPLVSLQLLLSFLSSFIPCVWSKEFSLLQFILVLFVFWGFIHHFLPLSTSGFRLSFTFNPRLQSLWIAMVWAREDVSKHKRALESVDRFIYRDWAACSQDGVVRTSLLSYSLNSSFNLGELKRKSCFTSKVPQTSHSQFLLKPGYTGCLCSNMWGTFNTILSQLPFSLP